MKNLSENVVLDQKPIMPIVDIVFPFNEYLFHCGIQNNAVGDKTTLHNICPLHHQNSFFCGGGGSCGNDYKGGCVVLKKMLLRFLNFDGRQK